MLDRARSRSRLPVRSSRSRLALAPLFVALVVASDYGATTPVAYAEPTQAAQDYQGGAYTYETEDVPVGASPDDYADTDPSALSDFHSTLDPHGTWVDDPTYGTVWVPNTDEVGTNFAPYVSNGGWTYDDDYVWDSYYDWGWAPFHYGRWVWVDAGSWAWIPGRTYAGAWVSWRVGPEGYGYVGWGPRAPGYTWHGGVAVTFASPRPGPVVFCGRDDLFVRGVGNRVVVGSRAAVIAGETHEYARAGGVARGPAPASLGIRADAVAHVSASNRGATMARSFARPATAQTMGGHAPAAHVVRYVRPATTTSGAAGGSRGSAGGGAPPPAAAPRAVPRAGGNGSAGAPRPSSGGGHRR